MFQIEPSLNEIEQEPGKLSRHPALFAHLHGRLPAAPAPLAGLPGVERAAAEDPRIRGEWRCPQWAAVGGAPGD